VLVPAGAGLPRAGAAPDRQSGRLDRLAKDERPTDLRDLVPDFRDTAQ
jgi:hypothetical protein